MEIYGCYTQTYTKVIDMVEGLKEGDHNSVNKPKLPQNHGSFLEIKALSCGDSKIILKGNPAKGIIDNTYVMIGFQLSKIQECKYTR